MNKNTWIKREIFHKGSWRQKDAETQTDSDFYTFVQLVLK